MRLSEKEKNRRTVGKKGGRSIKQFFLLFYLNIYFISY